MSEARDTPHRMTPDEFFEWQREQDRNYELVDGIAVLAPKAMTGASRRHDTITVNILRVLGNKLVGGPCEPHTADMTVLNPNGNVRRPDVTIDCTSGSDESMQTEEPRVIVEVLSPSTMNFDRFRKVEEYKTNEHIQVVLLVASQSAEVIVWRRGGAEWRSEIVETLDAMIALPEIGCELSLSDIYRGSGVADKPTNW
ncbi:Uma2 family endonuclease [Fulvimarina sp. MAC8]|uniref:Uma2 family endonuclease n=1 Tax=Fulvimarina sp. MAC8 TaxID=3162874 RepID=UPI0032EE3613